jgi:hypothetical protein
MSRRDEVAKRPTGRIGLVNLAGKSAAERQGKGPVPKRDVLGDALSKVSKVKSQRLGKREREAMKAAIVAGAVRHSQALTLAPIRPYVTQERLLGNTHTRGFHGPGMASGSERSRPGIERFSQAGFNAGKATLYRDGRSDPNDKTRGPTTWNRRRDLPSFED